CLHDAVPLWGRRAHRERARARAAVGAGLVVALGAGRRTAARRQRLGDGDVLTHARRARRWLSRGAGVLADAAAAAGRAAARPHGGRGPRAPGHRRAAALGARGAGRSRRMTIALILGGLVVLLFTGLPIFAGLTLFGGGLLLLTQGELGSVSEVMFGEMNRYLLVAIPLFAFMAHVMIRSRIVDDLYSTAYTLTRHLPGGIGVASVGACTLFAAISGSSVATALTIGSVAIPQMIRFGYSPRAAYGLVAAGGTLGILIPPSGPMVLYGVVSDASIGGLFMAGVIPGVLMALIFSAWAMVTASLGPRTVAREPRASA